MSWSRERRQIALLENGLPFRADCSRLVDMADGENMEVEMKIRGLMMDPMTNMPIVVLKDLTGDSVLPIWVGIYEANAIALEIEKVTTPRPMTHDLIKVLLMGLDTAVKKVVVSELKDDTFYALIWLERGGELISVDSRPSDALALALRHDCPIYVEERVLQSSKSSTAVSEKVNNEELRKWLENLNDEDLGRYKM
jgi:bifunctional DNase/RNase